MDSSSNKHLLMYSSSQALWKVQKKVPALK